ncbi:putative Mn2+ efflux pump MntP [Chromohalobacter marismortui]|uniref:Putative manganese efflux pump MntP n=1 Tax=Chromohalobacter marismortui TaxID=42055 RepID=A0A4R7NNB3_9GAMM|nr:MULTISPECIES: manganese efflux pump MntP family protein [Chromohalobacter]MCI0509817.1 manganese efflux pump MntP family protein [Chromohalobacter sp.]MCI0594506.1 manganese efflux pump MntP family protein [Chromohalobacter sp.]TDU22039.1 putative Mn2+ efflux pump MntP [Chromohalobacter marismortui]
MNPASLILLAFAMSTDAFAASVGRGAELSKVRFISALRIGIVFGVVEAIMPLVGWALGHVAMRFVSGIDHWIAFTMLAMLGGHMIWEGFKKGGAEAIKVAGAEHEGKSIGLIAFTALATSIDAMAVGITLALTDINIVVASLAIGLATTLMVTIGTLLGRAIGTIVGKWAEMLGGLILIAIGFAVLYEHLAVVPAP